MQLWAPKTAEAVAGARDAWEEPRATCAPVGGSGGRRCLGFGQWWEENGSKGLRLEGKSWEADAA